MADKVWLGALMLRETTGVWGCSEGVAAGAPMDTDVSDDIVMARGIAGESVVAAGAVEVQTMTELVRRRIR